VTLRPPSFDLRKHFKVLKIKCNEEIVISKIESIFNQLANDDFEATYDKVKFYLNELIKLQEIYPRAMFEKELIEQLIRREN